MMILCGSLIIPSLSLLWFLENKHSSTMYLIYLPQTFITFVLAEQKKKTPENLIYFLFLHFLINSINLVLVKLINKNKCIYLGGKVYGLCAVSLSQELTQNPQKKI